MRKKKEVNCRLNQVGGQAVLEGVMMKAGNNTATACRLPSGEIKVAPSEFISARKKHKVLNLPILRGIVNFVEMLILSMSTLTVSAEMASAEDEEQPSKGVYAVVSVIATILGIALAIGLFMFLPNLAVKGLTKLTGVTFGIWGALIEGGLKIVFFLLYLYLVSLMPDIRRTFEYHGAEHKSIACYESGEELTPANAKHHTRFHPRCGTSFIFVMLFLGILVGVLIRALLPTEITEKALLYTLIRLLILPIIVGVGYEYIMFAGKHANIITRILSAPGLWVQRITTREPDESQLEVAITALKYALVSAFPDFDREAVTYHPEEKKPATENDTSEIPAGEKDPDSTVSESTEPPVESKDKHETV